MAVELEDPVTCEWCDADVEREAAIRHEGNIHACPTCQARIEAAFASCDHEWHPSWSERGEQARDCDRCGCRVADDAFEAVTGRPPPPRDDDREERS